MPIIARDVRKRYGPITALRGVSLTIPEGEIVGLVGPNGAGKTTFIKSVVGLVVPDSASIQVDGIDWRMPEAKRLISYSPEIPENPDWATVCELLERLAWLEGMSLIDARREARLAAEKLGLRELCQRRIKSLSKGQKKRVMLAQALIPGDWKKYYLLDEPFTGLDPEWVSTTRSIIASLRDQGKGVLVSSHILRELEAIISRVAIIIAGKVIFEGPVSTLAEKFAGRPIVILRVDRPGDAVRILKESGYKAELYAGASVRVYVDSEHDADLIVSIVKRSGLRVLGYEIKILSLEDAYLRLLRGVRID